MVFKVPKYLCLFLIYFLNVIYLFVLFKYLRIILFDNIINRLPIIFYYHFDYNERYFIPFSGHINIHTIINMVTRTKLFLTHFVKIR